MTQIVAILVDSLRELKSRYLFWVSIGLSAIAAVSLFGLITFEENGYRILWLSVKESDRIYEGSDGARELMAWMFSAFVYWWLTKGALVLAILSTASILPGFLAGGSIEITLAKPIRRIWLFLFKVLGALLFVLLQTTICVVLAYVLLGVRAGIWIPETFYAIPLVVLQFFYLFAIMAFVAVVTRSTLASLIVTTLFWALVALIQFTSNQLDSAVIEAQTMIDRNSERIAEVRARAEDQGRELRPSELSRIRRYESSREPLQKQADMIEPYRRPINTVELLVPKTGDVQRIIADVTDAPTFTELMRGTGTLESDAFRPADFDEDEWRDMMDAGVAGDRAIRDVDVVESLGTSIAFSLVLLAGAGWLFVRKDF